MINGSEYEVVVKLKLENFETENEVREAIDSIIKPGLTTYKASYGDMMGKNASITNVNMTLSVPPFEALNQMIAAKLLSHKMTQNDRAEGAYKTRGRIAGAFYLVESVLTPVLHQVHANNYFEFYHKSGTSQYLIRDVLGNVVHDFTEIPDKVMELSQFFMTLVNYYKLNKDQLSVIETGRADITEIDPDIMDYTTDAVMESKSKVILQAIPTAVSPTNPFVGMLTPVKE